MRTGATKSGVIVNCLWAPLLEKPRNDSARICEVTALSEVLVFPEMAKGDFYLIRIPSGDEGYCLNEYVAVRR